MTHTNDAPVTVERETVERELQPCPHCGNERIGMTSIRDGYEVWCKCGATMQAHNPNARQKAIDQWNMRHRLAALASAPAGDGYGKWHRMLLDLVDAIHRDRGEKTQAIGIDLSYQQALAAALARPRAAVGEQSREAIARIIDPEAWQDVSNEDTYPAMLRRIAEGKAASLAKADTILALQSPPAKVEG